MALLIDFELTPPLSTAASMCHFSPTATVDERTNTSDPKAHHPVTTAVTREFDDLDPKLFAVFSMLATGLRTGMIHPMTIALARKQAVPHLAKESARSILSQMLRHEGGMRALTRGMGITVCAIAANETLANLTYEWSRSAAPFETDVAKESVGGFFSDALGRTVSTPMGLIANRQMIAGATMAAAAVGAAAVAEKAHRSALHHTRHVIRSEGVRGLAAGLSLSLFYGGLWSAAWWPVYCGAKRQLYSGWSETVAWANAEEESVPHRARAPSSTHHLVVASPSLGAVALGRDDLCGMGSTYKPTADSEGRFSVSVPSLRQLVRRSIAALPDSVTSTSDNLFLNGTAAAVSSGATAVIFNPCLVLMTRIQVNPGSTLRGICRSIYQEQGWRGFTAGTMLNVSACVVDGVLSASCYEWARRWSDRNATTAY